MLFQREHGDSAIAIIASKGMLSRLISGGQASLRSSQFVGAVLLLNFMFATTAVAQVTVTQTNKLIASDGATNDLLGYGVALSGNQALVGAYGDDSLRGAAYLYNTITGSQIRKLTASDGVAGDIFGVSVALGGNTAAVGAFRDDSFRGSVYLYDATTGTQTFKLTASDRADSDQFGNSLAVVGNRILVAANGDDVGSAVDQGSAYMFDTTTGNQLFKLTAADGAAGDSFGISVALSATNALVGSFFDDIGSNTDQGSAYVYDALTGAQVRKLTANDGTANDRFGLSVALSGNLALIGSYGDDSFRGSAYLFDITTGTQLRKFTASDGAVNDWFGSSLAISGNFALIGSRFDDIGSDIDRGSAYLFDLTTGAELAKITSFDGAGSDRFGWVVALSGNTALIGADGHDTNGNSDRGAAYTFTVTTSSVAPEPSAISFIAFGILVGMRRLRRRDK